MTKKTTKKTTKPAAAPPANANTVGPKKGAQGKLAGTGRLDADEEIEAQAEKVRKLTDQWQLLGGEMVSERSTLTELLKDKKRSEYIYEDDDGEMRRAFIPKSAKEPQAKVQKLKKIQPDAD